MHNYGETSVVGSKSWLKIESCLLVETLLTNGKGFSPSLALVKDPDRLDIYGTWRDSPPWYTQFFHSCVSDDFGRQLGVVLMTTTTSLCGKGPNTRRLLDIQVTSSPHQGEKFDSAPM